MPISTRVNGVFIKKTLPVTLHNNLLRFRDRDKKFDLQGKLLKMMTNKTYIVDLAKILDNFNV